jgi:hypothetical protein
MPAYFEGLLWLLLLLGPLLILQRILHRETQAIFLLLTRRGEIALALFSLLFFPGVLLHETSHFIMARLLGVRTGRFSLLPHPLPNGRLQLGFVETAATDWIRDALIGGAPLILGGAFVAYAGLERLGLTALWWNSVMGGPSAFLDSLPSLYGQPDFWVWFYLTFAVSSTMLPSPSDRRAWLPVAFVVAILLLLSLLAGAGPWLLSHLASPLDQIFRALAIVLGISDFVHLVLLLPLWGVRRALVQITGLDVA